MSSKKKTPPYIPSFSPPYGFRQLDLWEGGHSPSTVHCQNTALTGYFRYYLINKALRNFEFVNFPAEWSLDYFRFVLFCIGYIGVVKTDRYGIIPQKVGLKGYNIYYQPRELLVASPFSSISGSYTIGDNCELVKFSPGFTGIMDIVNLYRENMALVTEARGMNVINTKLAYVAKARTKAGAETMKAMFDEIQRGNPAVVVDESVISSNTWELFSQNLSGNFIAPELLATLRTWERRFLSQVGYQTRNEEKKERLITDEVTLNEGEVTSLAELWVDSINSGFEAVGRIFPNYSGIKVRLKAKEALDVGEAETNSLRRVGLDKRFT